MKISKRIISLLIAALIGTTFIGCGKKEEVPPIVETPAPETSVPETPPVVEEPIGETDPTVSAELLFTITDGLEMPSQVAMPKEMFGDTYGIDETLLESYIVNMPMMNVKANECAVFELKDEKDSQAVLEGITKRQKALEEQWKTYLPDQYELVQNYKTAVKGNKILFVIDEHAEQIVENFNQAVKE
ncbi:hypothetical protein CS063_15665 [Sporanaerobium hydrogeniformans]|uniref:Uncharacterized protein n=1 Tax=Sporanaerobium hydrogeniformans TaxID=3072179 RepID=A0AC61D7C4_9FIRM|nr:DUF4358 domain-containing protein [Sporanaerobium hydrogeniformans]PHV69435.1 hypothetical protein CS063_15665 [Sporanaerobium hydrogeniformans]